WEEHPFEWVEGRRFGVLREFSRGPFRWFLSVVELEPHGTGTRLTHRLELEPGGFLGRLVARFQIGFRARRSLERLYRRIDDVLTGKSVTASGTVPADPFEDRGSLGRARRLRLDQISDELLRRGVDGK